MEPVVKGLGSVLMTYTIHYGVAKLYNYVCVPDGAWGFITGLMTMGSPICQVAVKAMSITQLSYSSLIMMGISRVFIDFTSYTKTPVPQQEPT